MKILMLLDIPEDTGSWVGRYHPLAKGLARLGHQVVVLMPRHDVAFTMPDLGEPSKSLSVISVGRPYFRKVSGGRQHYGTLGLMKLALTNLLRMLVITWRFRPDVLFLGKPLLTSSTAAVLLKFIFNYPLLVDCDDYEAVTNSAQKKLQHLLICWFEDHIPTYADAVTTHTTFLLDRLSSLGVMRNNLHYIPNGVDEERFGQFQVPEIYKHLGERPTVLYLGDLNLSSGHSVDLLFDAFSLVRQVSGLENTVLVVVGDGKDEAKLRVLVSKLNVSDAVIWAGRVPPKQVAGYLQLADVLVDPIRAHPGNLSRCPLKLLEAAYLGTPIVTSDYGDRKRILPEGCKFVQEGKREALAEGISRVLLMPEEELTQKRDTLRTLGQMYGWKGLSTQVEAICHDLFDRGNTV